MQMSLSSSTDPATAAAVWSPDPHSPAAAFLHPHKLSRSVRPSHYQLELMAEYLARARLTQPLPRRCGNLRACAVECIHFPYCLLHATLSAADGTETNGQRRHNCLSELIGHLCIVPMRLFLLRLQQPHWTSMATLSKARFLLTGGFARGRSQHSAFRLCVRKLVECPAA